MGLVLIRHQLFFLNFDKISRVSELCHAQQAVTWLRKVLKYCLQVLWTAFIELFWYGKKKLRHSIQHTSICVSWKKENNDMRVSK